MYVYVKRVKHGGKTYYYLVVEEYDPKTRRKSVLLHLSLSKILEEFSVDAEGVGWCGGWDLNPRRPTPSGPKPDPFDQARAPPRLGVRYYVDSLGWGLMFYPCLGA